MAKVKVTLVRSFSGRTDRQIATARGLGLTKRGRSRVIDVTPETKGMLHKLNHMITVEPEGE